MWFNIEIKQEEPSIVQLFCEKIEQYGLEDQILVASFQQETLDEFRLECPEVATSADRNEVTWFYALSRIFLERILFPEAVALQVPEYEGAIKILGRRFINGAGNRNLEVHSWTINESGDMGRLLDLGVDGIITDYPDRLMALLNC